MSPPQPTPPPDSDSEVDDVGSVISFSDLVGAFLKAVPTPTDEQLHSFSSMLGIDYQDFEEQVFQMLGDRLEDENIDDLMDDDDILEDDLDVFIVLFFGMNPSPTEEQVHSLAELVGSTPEELEERIYSLLSKLDSDGQVEDDDDDDEDTDTGDDSVDDDSNPDDDDAFESDDVDAV